MNGAILERVALSEEQIPFFSTVGALVQQRFLTIKGFDPWGCAFLGTAGSSAVRCGERALPAR